MVTKKTRLMSAVLAVMMLISLFTAITPVYAGEDFIGYDELAAIELNYDIVGDWPSEGLIPYKYRTAGDTATNYAITDAADWLAAVADSNAVLNADGEAAGPLGITAIASAHKFDGITLWFTGDIDFAGVDLDQDGDGTVEYGEVLFNIYSTSSFSGTIRGQGFAIKNLNLTTSFEAKSKYQAFGLVCYGTADKAVIRDLTLASGTFNVTNTAAAYESQVGVFMGYGYGSIIANCWNNIDMNFTDNSSTNCSVSCFGRKQYCTVVNCFNTGDFSSNDSGGRISILSEWRNSNTYDLNIYNSFNYGTSSTHTAMGLVSTNTTAANATTNVNLSNVINVGYPIAAGSNNKAALDAQGTILEAGAEGGELAWMLNKNYDTTYDATYGRRYYALENGKTVWGAANNYTVKVEFYFGGELYSESYVDLNEAVDVVTLCDIEDATFTSANATVVDDQLTVTSAPADTLTVTVDVTTTAKVVADTTPLTDWITAFEESGKDTTYYTVDGTATGETLATAIERVEANITNEVYVYASEVEEEVEKLASYKMYKVVPFEEWDTYKDDAAGYDGIDTVAELEAIADIVKNGEVKFAAHQTLYITGNIDFGGESYTGDAINLGGIKAAIDGSKAPGGVATLSNLYTPTSWLGNPEKTEYTYVPALKNLTFVNFHSTATPSNGALIIGRCMADCVIENVTLDGCSADLSATTASVAGGLLIGRTGEVTIDLKNITIKNSKLHRGVYDGAKPASSYANTGFVVAKTIDTTKMISVDGLYMINNEITGLRRGNGAGIAFGEILNPMIVKNVGIFNTTVQANDGSTLLGDAETNSNIKGVLFGLVKDSNCTTLKVENVIAANNKAITQPAGGEAVEEPIALIQNAESVSGVEIKNIYTDSAVVMSAEEGTIENANAVETAVVTSGEAAYALNNALAGTKWTMDGTAPAFGTESNMTVRVALELDGTETEYLYADLGEEITLAHTVAVDPTFTLKETVDYATITGNKITVTGVPTNAEMTVYVTVTTEGLIFAALDEKIAEIGENAAYYVNAEGTALLTDVLAAIKEKRAAGYAGLTQDDVNADLDTLNSYTLCKDPSFTTVEMIVADLEKYIVDGENLMTKYFEKGEDLNNALENAKLALTLKKDSYTDGLDAKPAVDAINAAVTLYNGASDKALKTDVAFKDRAPFQADGFEEFGITDEADWRLLVENMTTNEFTTGMTLKLTNDIDMLADGEDDAVRPLGYVDDKYFNGTLDGQGYVFKNLKIEEAPENHDRPVGLIAALGATAVVKNLGIESGSITVNWGVPNMDSATNGLGIGGIAGSAASGAKIINCWNGASVTLVEAALRTDLVPEDASDTIKELAQSVENDVSVGGIVGRGLRGTLVDGCYNVGTITGLLHASGINDWTQSKNTSGVGTVLNSFNAGSINATNRYLVRTSGSDAAAAQINNYAIGTAMTATNASNSVNDSYLFGEEYATGEIAWKLNKNAYDGGNGTTYYTVENGKTVFGTADNQTRRVTFADGTVEYYAYVANGTTITYGGNATVVGGDIVINVEAGTLAHAEHDMKYTDACRPNYHIAYCDGAAEIAGITAYCDYTEYVACSNLKKEVVESSVDAETHAHKYVEICQECNHEFDAVDCVADFNEEVTSVLSCTQDGVKTFTCQTCGYFYTETTLAEGHALVNTPNGDQTHKVTCEKCDLPETNVPCTPDEEAWEQVTPPSEDATGLRKTVCTVCGGEVTDIIAKTAVLKAESELNATETEAVVRVALKNNPGVSEMKLLVTYDATAMTLTGAIAGNYAGANIGAPAGEGSGIVTKEIAVSAATDLTGDDLLVSLVFEIANDGAGNITASNKDYTITVAAADGKNAAAAEVAFGADDATITITQGSTYVKGDLNGDTVVDIADAVLMLRYCNTKPDGATEAVIAGYTITDAMADLIEDGDDLLGDANINDVVYLLQYVNGWYTAL